MSALDAVFPSPANNDYRGGKIPLYAFCALIPVVTFRSFVHLLKDDSGVNSIASIVLFSGDPDPNNVIYMFSALWGSQQVIMWMVYLIVLWRYRNLIPLMWVLFAVEVVFRMVVGELHPLTPDFYERTPPGKTGNLPMLTIGVAMAALSIRNTSRSARPAASP